MSFSTSDALGIVPTGRKRTISERVTQNGDPLVAKKKAREAAKQQTSSIPVPATLAATSAPLKSTEKTARLSLKVQILRHIKQAY
jgi:hypothetical protein